MNYTKLRVLLWLFVFTPLFSVAQKEFTLEEIYAFKFYARPAQDIQWMKNDQFYGSFSPESGLSKVPIDKPENATKLIDAKLLVDAANKPLQIGDYKFNDDETKVLFTTNEEKIYRHSFTAVCYVFDLKTQKLSQIFDGRPVQLATFSPDGGKVGFVFENNLYFTDLSTNQTKQITNDGAKNNVINGATDWVYEEEFSFTQAFHFSPDSKKIAFYRFDESKVPLFSMESTGALYPETYTFKYPKAGEKNAVVEIHVYDMEKGASLKADIGRETDQYIPRIQWTRSADKLAVLRLNRRQNKLDLMLVDSKSGSSQTILTEESKTYVDVTDETFTFLKNSDQFLFLNERDGYNHLYLYDMTGKQIRQITSGEWEISAFYGLDEAKSLLYFQSTEGNHIERQIYVIGLDGKGKKQLSEGKGWHSAKFSSEFNHFIDTYSNADTPPVVNLYGAKGKLERPILGNEKVMANLKDRKISKREFFDFTTADNVKLFGWMIRPQNFDASKKYPVLMFTYGGPGSQEVDNKYDPLDFYWYQILAAKGYLVACVDGRGTGGRGAAFKNVTYQDLGKYECIDQIAAAKYLGGLPFVDKNRIGIWGWSFGGYLSGLCLAKGADVFKMAISVAPVTNWRYYDTIYTERYLRTPQENPKGYDDNSPINFAKQIKGAYLLVHGMADDNVHFQNSVELSNALIKAGVNFDQAFYPNCDHSIFGPGARLHLYRKMTDFVLNKL